MINKTIDLLYLAKQHGIEIVLNEEQLQLKLPKNKSIDKNLLQEIKDSKEAIIEFLRNNQRSARPGNNITRADRSTISRIPISFSQERLWFIDRFGGSSQYHMPSVLRLKGKLNKDALFYALQTVLERHEVVRSIYLEEDGQVYQQVKDAKDWNLNFVDGAAYKSDKNKLRLYIESLIGQPFDLSKDYMLRATLINLEEQDYVLVLTMHHIVSDGWSRSILVKEVMELYRAFEEKKEHQLDALPLQYADYAIWQRKNLSGGLLDKKISYWREKLDGVLPLELPTDFTRPAIQGTRGASMSFTISKQLTGQLQELSQQQGATMFITMLAAFNVLLYRYSGQKDICVATPVAGRQQHELEGLIGFFVNTLALRSQVEDDTSFLDLLQAVKKTTLDAQEHQEVPFEKVVDAVVKERSLSLSPLAQVMFALLNTPEAPTLKMGELEFSGEGHEHTTAMFDITFFVNESPDGLKGLIEYSTELFSERTIGQMMEHFKALLSSIIEMPTQKIGDISMLSKDEEVVLLEKFNDNKIEYTDNKTIIDFFEEQAENLPGNIALVFNERQITYKELNEAANSVAHYLQSKGVKAEMLVPVCIERGIEMVIGILGILKAGAAYVPVDPEYPADRINYMLQDCNAKMVLSSRLGSHKIPLITGVEVIELDGDNKIIGNHPVVNPAVDIRPQQLAYVIYTSGSTGRPKGVMIEHRNVYAFICWCQQEFASSKFDIVYASTSICFDLSVYELFYPLSIGKPIRIIENGLYIGKYLKDDKFVLTNSVPVVVENLLKEGRDLRNISVINMAGEPVPLQVQQGLDTEKIEVRNLYGPTEDTTYSTIYRLKQNMPILIGKPISNSSVYILNRKGHLVPIGVAGEICIGGAGVARGYLNNPELTAEKFIQNNFATENDGKLYRTGDLGRWLPDGNIEYLGRIDEQVKIRGFRVELGEVETVLNDLEQVSSSCVVVKKHGASTNTLVSYFIPDSQVVKEKEKELYQAQVLSWKEVYEIEYEQTEGKESVNEEFNLIGWNDSFTGEAIPEQQMGEWVHEIVDKILSLHPENVLEIGCGTGLIFYQLAGKVKKYIGTDFSRSSINQITERISKGLRNYGPTQLYVSAAHEVSVSNEEKVDTIILNSIVQYFPGEEYMNDVIKNSIGILNGSGRIIIGDVRDNRLLGLFKGRLHLNKMQQSVNVKEFRWAVDQDVLKEEELCLSPVYFYGLRSIYPEITHIEIEWKKASYINELSLYRYTVVIYVGVHTPVLQPAWLSSVDQKEEQEILRQIDNATPIIAIKDFANPRLWKERQLSKAMQEKAGGKVGDLIVAIENEDKENASARELLDLAIAKGYQYRLLVDEDPFKVNILLELEPTENFIQQQFDGNNVRMHFAPTNIPLFTDISLLLQKDIRALLKTRLPEYMVPSEMIALAQLPLNNNGKIDRRFLSDREDITVSNKLDYLPPSTVLETNLANIWQDLLRIERVGIKDNFFELGGHSLLVMRLISAVRRELGVELAIKDLFVYPTILKLAAYLESLTSTALVLPPVKPVERPKLIPLSFSQERLWFVDRLEGSVAFHVPSVLELKGKLNIEALSYALQTIVDRHEVLRTVFLEQDGYPYQWIMDKGGWKMKCVDGSKYAADKDALQEYVKQLLAAPFDLQKDHTLRADLISLSEEKHILVATLHHIASDAWSLGIMLKEVVELYKAFTEARPVSLPTLSIQYADFAIWQRNHLTGELLNHKLNYWKEKLNQIEPLQLPTDFPRPPLQSTKGTIAEFTIDKQLADQLKELGRQNESTLFMTLLAAFKVLLHRYSGQQDICVGTSIAGRQQQEIEDLMGFFVNILALRTSVDPDSSFTSLLESVKQTTLDAYEHQEVPFEKVVDAVVKERDISRSPLFQVLLVVLNTPAAPKTVLGDVTLSAISYEHTSSKYDITVFVTEAEQGLKGLVEYSTELFSEQTILRMMAHLHELLQAIVTDPLQKVRDLPLLTKGEEQELLQDFNATVLEYPRHKSIIELFELQVQEDPAALAVMFQQETLTYADLSERSNRLANYLIGNGIRPGTNIALLSYRGIEMIVGMFGILKAGCAYVPINIDYPVDRINFIIEDAGINHIVHSSHELLQATGLDRFDCIHVNDSVNALATQPGITTASDSCAYVMFTSGTTGRPKGIAVSQQNIIKLVFDGGPISITPADRVLQWSNYSFDGSTYDIYSSLLKGAAICMIKDSWASDIDELSKVIISKNITVCFITTALFNTFIDVRLKAFIGLRKILFGGEMVSMSHVRKALSVLGQGKIVHVYGPTETTVYACSYAIDKLVEGTGVPIGKPLSNTRFYVLNKDKRLVPVGVPGELYIGGDGVSLGYVNNSSLTAERFVQNPYNSSDDDRLYCTGDIVRWLPGGVIEYLSRIDDQVKIRGFRIELGEIESVLQECDLVRHAAVLAKTDRDGTKRLVAYVVPNDEFDKQGIQSYLKNKLPDYMVPALMVEMESLPLNANGKIDRKALPDPEPVQLNSNEFVAAESHAEKVLANIWQKLLGLDEVGIHDNFFEIGGDSLLAIRVVSAIRKELEIEMPISNIFEFQTIALLSEQLESRSEAAVLPAIQLAQRPPRIPLSFSQERLWFIDRLEGSQQYHIPAVIRLKGELNGNALEYALQAIINRHEVLRTIFLEKDGNAYQVVKEKADRVLPSTNAINLKNDKTGLQKLIRQLVSSPFDLSKDNMLRANLVILGEQEHILVVTLHHIASDGWSRSILVKEVAELYAAFEEKREAALGPLPVQYADFAIWQRNHLRGEVLDKKLAYWQQKLQGVEPLQLPIDFPRPAIQTTRGGNVGFTFDKELSDALHQFSQQQGSTLFMTLITALKVLLYRYSGQKDICVGTGIAGRQQQEVEGLIGFFVNTLALRTELNSEESFTNLLQQVRTTTMEAYENQEVPFEKVVDVVIKKRDRSRNPIFQVMFVLQNTPEVPSLELGKLQLVGEGHEHTTAQFDLSFSITESIHGLNGSLEYNADLYKITTIERLLTHFKQLVIAIINEPLKKISELSIISKEEAHQVMFDFNANETTYPKDKTIIALFEEQVVAAPDSIAVIFEDKKLTYGELNKKANQLAHYLVSKGVKEETLVAISSERSLNMITGILGILKAGGAYVPIDAAYPAERIQFMLDDTAVRILLTSETVKAQLSATDKFEIISLEGDWANTGLWPDENVKTNVEPWNLAYIIYTSGSTGKPKGVMVTQQNVVSLVKGIDYVSLTNEDVLLSTGSSSFDATTIEYWGMLLNGGQLVLCTEDTLMNSGLLKAEIDSRKISRMWFTSSWFNQLVESDITLFEGLKTVMVGGEKLSERHIEKFRQTYPHIEVINGYGPTENTTFSLTYKVTESTIKSAIPIGRPLNNRKAYILDEKLQLVPVGVAGEICLSGAGLSRGYLNRPALTAEKFVSMPFDKNGIEKIYKTGDVGRWLPDGNIEYLGRIDEQVKIRGYRIELGEIEAVLLESELISQAVVLVWGDKEGNKRLVGYVLPNGLYNKNLLISNLKTKLPDYMIPSMWVELEHLPLTSNGKVDKRALPDPIEVDSLSNQYAAPATDMEMKLVAIWQEILHVDRIGVNDNFFELGGHSLLAMRLMSAVRKELQIDLAVKELFNYPTIVEMSNYLQQQEKGSLLPAIKLLPRPEHIPLSFSQERLWFIDQLEGSVSYNSPTVLRLKGKLNEEALFYAVQNIISRHEVLRTVFHEFEGKPYQSVIDAINWRPSLVDGSMYKDDKAGLQSFIQKLIAVPFDLSKDYMLHAQLITLQAEDYVLLVTMHHIASDGWSMPIIVKEVVELYNAFTEDRPATLAPLPLQYADYAIWQRKYLEGEVMEKKAAYWKSKLNGVSPLELPTDFSRPAIRTVNGASVNFMIEKELADKLMQLSNQQGTTLFMTLLSTYKVMLQRYSGQQDIAVGASIANRPQQELEGLIGFFVNTLALRTEFEESSTFVELLQLVKTTVLDAYEHQDVPFEKVVEEVVKERDPSRSPLFQVMMVLLNTPATSTLGFGEVELSNEPFEIKISKFEITFHVSQSPYGLPVSVVYNTDLFRNDTIIRMTGHFKQLLQAVVNDPHQTIDLLQMLTESEEQELLLAFN